MKVGITVNFQFSFFSGGGGCVSLAISELCKHLGHEVVLVNTNGRQEWWDDIKSVRNDYPTIFHVEDWKTKKEEEEKPLDLLLEVSSTLSTQIRQKLSNTSIWVVRKPILLHDIENSIFPLLHTKRELDGLTAIWALDTEVTKDELDYLRILGHDIPVLHVSNIWTPTHLESHRKEINAPEWLQLFAFFVQQKNALPAWSVHIPETNTSASSSCTIPIVALREVKRTTSVPLSPYKIHNADHIQKSEFFLSNVYKHSQIQDLSGGFFGRQRVCDWIFDPASVIFAHARFRPIRPFYLDALYCGIPIIHNSTPLKDIGGLYWYNENSITEAVQVFQKLHSDLLSGQGMFQQGYQETLRKQILDRWGPTAPGVVASWKAAFESVAIASRKATAAVPSPVSAASPAPPSTRCVRVLFTDMWDDFNPRYNMFLLMMKEALRRGNINVRVEGYESNTLPAGERPHLVVFGPFGDEWKADAWKGVPKAHFTGENTVPVQHPEIVLNMGFPHAEFVDEKYIRLPLWMLEIDWFGAEVERLQNPKPLPIDRCTKVYPEEIGEKKKFCAFVVTNPCNPVRNNAFHWLSQYKQVDSAGRLFNNVGDAIFAGRGGGGGELLKHKFLKQYKFCLSFENASSQGYTTEKLLHAKAAGCIPIYWGDPKVERDFDPHGFIDARTIQSSTELIELVKKVDTDPSLYLRMLATPALDEYKRDLVRRTLREVACVLLKSSGVVSKEETEAIPKLLGGATTEEAAAIGLHHKDLGAQPLAKEIKKVLPSSTAKREVDIAPPLIITYATHNYLASVQQLLAGFSIQKQHIPELDIRVYIASDVPQEALKLLSANYGDMQFIRVPDNAPPEGGFSDFWHPQHFAWKLWLLNTVNAEKNLNNRLVLYMDAGVFCSRWPTEWLRIAFEEGVCVLEDPRQTNEQWCHDVFKQKLQMTKEECDAHQIFAGTLAFRAGSPQANALFGEAYALGKQRDLIVGAKWEGVRNGKPYGHRHDQSILTLLAIRHNIAHYPLDEVYCQTSLRKTFTSGKAFYVHRGQFMIHRQFSPGIDDAFVINLDRRKDRMKKLFDNSPELELRVERISAFEGKKLILTPQLARLFRPHDFMWKKAIMGCALSHLSLWYRLVNEKKDINTYLILEDDVKLSPEWEQRWTQAQPHIPENFDILYLGGILPPNREAFERNKEKVNAHWSRVANNQIFGQTTPSPYFHWCAYAYVLSKQGAEKVLKLLHAHDGYWTSADHMLCNHVEHMNIYFLDPLVAGCYQDDDPIYKTSAFNDFNRVDKFDSDLWNNDERFTPQEIVQCLTEAEGKPLDVREALLQAVEQQLKVKEEVLNDNSPQQQASYKERILPLVAQPPSPSKKRLVCLEQHGLVGPELYEAKWLVELLGKDIPLQIEKIKLGDVPPSDIPIVFYQKPHIEAYKELFKHWEAHGKSYFLLHLSDEYTHDDIACYASPFCLGILRMYDRPDIPTEVRKKMVLLPLGYHHTISGGSDNPVDKTPRLPFRNYKWSFVGTKWAGRDTLIEPLKQIGSHKLLLLDSWESKEKISREEYLSVLLDSYFVPCFAGNNNETYRLYEALECGCIPMYVKNGPSDTYADYLLDNLGIMATVNWDEALKLMQHLLNNLGLLENYRTMMLNRWIGLKKKLHTDVETLLAKKA